MTSENDVLSATYQVMMIDPPWPKRKGGLRKSRPNQGRKLDYATMSLEAIESCLRTEILPLADPQGHTLFVWAIDQFLHEAEQMMARMGYREHARLIWDKQNGVAPAFSIRYTHEYLLWFYAPKFQPVCLEMRGKFGTVFQGKQSEHSRKPDEAYDIVGALFPSAEKLDVFSREYRQGWDAWGDECGKFNGGA